MARRSKSRRRSSTRRKTQSQGAGNLKWYLLIAVCAVVVGGFGYAAFSLAGKNQTDEVTLCHKGGALNVTAILLDLTDPLTKTQHARLKTILQKEVRLSSTDTMISFGVVSENPDNWGVRFAKCKPETGANANALYANPRQISQRYDREFTQPMQAKLADAIIGQAENQSPIMEALQSLISQTPEFTRVKGHRKIIIVSDMLQHSATLSFYRGQGWDYFAENGGMERLSENLDGVSIEILKIPRTGPRIPGREIVEGFWTRYFDRQGSRAPSVQVLGDL